MSYAVQAMRRTLVSAGCVVPALLCNRCGAMNARGTALGKHKVTSPRCRPLPPRCSLVATACAGV
eukprot:9480833-Pyramimonas_sp.AAC.1